MKAVGLCVCLLVWPMGVAYITAQQPQAEVSEVSQASLPKGPIVFGEAFELTITSTAAMHEDRLLPLQVELLDRTATPAGEQWRYRARCYQLGEVTLALSPPVTLSVASSLPEPPGDLEWPSQGWQLAADGRSAGLLYGLLAMAAVFVGAWWRFVRRAGASTPVPASTSSPPWDAALELRELVLGDGGEETFCQQVKAIVRRHCAQRFGLPAEVRTSEELLALLSSLQPYFQPSLQPCLAGCDLLLFGGVLGNREVAAAAHAQALQFVNTTGSLSSGGREVSL